MIFSHLSGRVRQIVAVPLLDYAAADMFIPGICQTDFVLPPLDLNSTTRLEAFHADQKLPASRSTFDEDCFCCCSHIILYVPLCESTGVLIGYRPAPLPSHALDGFQLSPYNPPKHLSV